MSLDQNLFTLHFTPNKDNPNVIDLIDPAGNIHYRKQRLPGAEYKIEVYDWHSESLLVTASSLAPATKVKTLELYNPSSIVELKSTGTLSFRWNFKWEEHEFEWKREECYLIRKPDPPVLVAVTKEPAGRLKTTSVQILDYNIHRFDFNDRKGLEIVILTALLTFQDLNESYHTPEGSAHATPTQTRKPSSTNAPSVAVVLNPPTLPPKPDPKTGVDRIAELQAVAGEYNEVTVDVEGHPDDYATYCARLLEDEALLFITIKSASAEQVPKVLQVVEQTKRIRHKAGDDNGLHQYVLYDIEQQKGPKRINLDDTPKGKDKYKPPESLTIHLSKIDMPELQPKAQEKVSASKQGDSSSREKKATKSPPRSPTSTPNPTKLHKPSSPHISTHAQAPGHSRTSSAPHIHTTIHAPPPPPISTSTRPPNGQPPSFPTPYGNGGHAPHGPYSASSPSGPYPSAGAMNSNPRPTSYHPAQGQIPPWQALQQSHGQNPTPLSPQNAAGSQKPGTVTSVVTGLFDSLKTRKR